MKIIKQKMKVLRQYLHYGEVKQLAAKNNVEYSRAKEITRGRISPRQSEIPFALDIINTVMPRMQELKRFEKVPVFEGDNGPTMGMSY